MQSDSHKLQLMKASLFVNDDYDHISIESDKCDGRDSPDQIVPSKSIFSHRLLLPSSKDDDSDMSVFDTINSRKATVDEIANKADVVTIAPKPFGPISSNLFIRSRIFLLDVNMTLPIHDSIVHRTIKKTKNTTTFFHGRKFKMGFGPGNKFVVLGSPNQHDSLFNGRKSDDATRAHLKLGQI